MDSGVWLFITFFSIIIYIVFVGKKKSSADITDTLLSEIISTNIILIESFMQLSLNIKKGELNKSDERKFVELMIFSFWVLNSMVLTNNFTIVVIKKFADSFDIEYKRFIKKVNQRFEEYNESLLVEQPSVIQALSLGKNMKLSKEKILDLKFSIEIATLTHSIVVWSNDLINKYQVKYNSHIPRKGTKTYSNGDVYDGEWKDGKLHGQGTKTYANGAEYDGEWKDGKFHGQGTMIYPDGAEYDGEWKDGKFHGQGTMIYPDGAVYHGEWKDHKQNGQGTVTYSNGVKYVGLWENGKPVK